MWHPACMENANWSRLAEEVLARRHALGISQEELARRGGPSHQSIRNIELGAQTDYRPLTLSRLENVLWWKPGTVLAILDGTADHDRDSWIDTGGRTVQDTAHASDFVGPPAAIQHPTGAGKTHSMLNATASLGASAAQGSRSGAPQDTVILAGSAISRAVGGTASMGLVGLAATAGDSRNSVTTVARVGIDLVDLIERHFSDHPESKTVKRVVLGFVQRILADDIEKMG